MSISQPKHVAVIGASGDRRKFGNIAVRAYRSEGWVVYPVNPHADEIEGLQVFRRVIDIPGPVERATLYLRPEIGISILEDVAAKQVEELFLNPGSESSEIIARAQELGIRPVVACSIVDIGRSPANPD